MTPQEKADQLFAIFRARCIHYIAKECATLCAREILIQLKESTCEMEGVLDYWEQVIFKLDLL